MQWVCTFQMPFFCYFVYLMGLHLNCYPATTDKNLFSNPEAALPPLSNKKATELPRK